MKKIVILIHGYLTDSNDFNKLEKDLVPYYDYVVSLNLPGHGKYQNMKDFTLDATFKYLFDEISFYLTLGKVDLIGFSLGGALVHYLCAKFKNINKAILLAPAIKYLNFSCPFKRMRYTFFQKQNRLLLKANDQITRKIAKEQFFKNIRLTNIIVFQKIYAIFNVFL